MMSDTFVYIHVRLDRSRHPNFKSLDYCSSFSSFVRVENLILNWEVRMIILQKNGNLTSNHIKNPLPRSRSQARTATYPAVKVISLDLAHFNKYLHPLRERHLDARSRNP